MFILPNSQARREQKGTELAQIKHFKLSVFWKSIPTAVLTCVIRIFLPGPGSRSTGQEVS